MHVHGFPNIDATLILVFLFDLSWFDWEGRMVEY